MYVCVCFCTHNTHTHTHTRHELDHCSDPSGTEVQVNKISDIR